MSDEKSNKVYSAEDTEILSEYDFEKMELHQGRTARRLSREANTRVLEPELAKRFPDDASVNAALEELLRLKGESA